MPQSTVLPAQAVEFIRDVWYPAIDRRSIRVGTALNTNGFTRARGGTTARDYNDPAGRGNVGGDPAAAIVGGRFGAQILTNATTHARGWTEGWWRAGYDAAGFNPGSFLAPDSVVFVLDFSVACTSAAFVAGTQDVTGFWFVPAEQFPPNLRDSTPGGSAAQGGFGLALGDDGAGANQWQFVTYDNLAVTSRTPVAVGNVTEWNRFRFMVVSAASGRPARLTVQANGSTFVDGIPFDDVTLFRPSTLTQIRVGLNSPGWIFGEVLADMLGDGWTFDLRWRQGRFTPDGTQVQGA